jgi:hypothetical protein
MIEGNERTKKQRKVNSVEGVNNMVEYQSGN